MVLCWYGKGRCLEKGEKIWGGCSSSELLLGNAGTPHATQAIGTGLALTACLGVDRYVTVTYIFRITYKHLQLECRGRRKVQVLHRVMLQDALKWKRNRALTTFLTVKRAVLLFKYFH